MAEIMPDGVKFWFLKSQQFRVIHVDGAIGGVTPRGLIHAAVYNERAAIPQSTYQKLSSDGMLGETVSVESKEGIIREVEVDMMMSKQTAIEFRDWLSARIAELEGLEAEVKKRAKDV
jgi:hypothetical protein